MFDRATDAFSVRRLDEVAKKVVAHRAKLAAPGDDAGPREPAPEAAAPKRPAPSRPADFPCDNARKRPEKCLKSLPSLGAHEQVQVGPDVDKFVDSNSVAHSTSPKGLSHRTPVLEQGPIAGRPPAVEGNVHGPSCADRALEFTPVTPHLPAVLDSPKLTTQLTSEELQRHLANLPSILAWGNVLLRAADSPERLRYDRTEP